MIKCPRADKDPGGAVPDPEYLTKSITIFIWTSVSLIHASNPWNALTFFYTGMKLLDGLATGGMSMNDERLGAWAPRMLSVLRIVTGLIFLEHGVQKFLSFPPGPMAGGGLALDTPASYPGIVEFAAALLTTRGRCTRPAAFLATGTMAVAYWIAHAPQNPFPVNNGGDAAILYCFVFLYFVFAGPGPWSLDASRTRRAV